MSDAKVIDRELDAMESEIANLRGAARRDGSRPGNDAHDRLQRLYLRRDALQAKAFRALQRKIRKMPK